MRPRLWPFTIFPAGVFVAAWYAAIRAGLVWPMAVVTFGLAAIVGLAWWGIQPGRKA